MTKFDDLQIFVFFTKIFTICFSCQCWLACGALTLTSEHVVLLQVVSAIKAALTAAACRVRLTHTLAGRRVAVTVTGDAARGMAVTVCKRYMTVSRGSHSL